MQECPCSSWGSTSGEACGARNQLEAMDDVFLAQEDKKMRCPVIPLHSRDVPFGSSEVVTCGIAHTSPYRPVLSPGELKNE